MAERLTQRSDDTLEALKTRMEEYNHHLQPIKNLFGDWVVVDADRDKDQVFGEIVGYIGA